MPQDYDEDDHRIDGALVETKVLKGSCYMCNFSGLSPGDTKYTVEHWMRRDDYYQNKDGGNCSDEISSSINWGAPGREHLCPGCAVERGLDHDQYYEQNKNAPSMLLREGLVMTERGLDYDRCYEQNKNTPPTPPVAKNSKVGCQNVVNLSKPNEVSNANNDIKLRFDFIAKQLNNSSNKIKSCHIRPHPECPLFVAWNGVIVLVYSGFPPFLITAKEQLSSSKLKEENFGSKWPKTTMAAVFDTAPGMTIEELTRLKQICQEYGHKIANISSNAIPITQLSLVQYECRSLEKVCYRLDISLEKDANSEGYVQQPCDNEKEVVNSVLCEWSSLKEYLPKVNQPGSRIKSYRQSLLSTSTNLGNGGVTCVAFLDYPAPSLHQMLVEFRIAVDLEFPGRYAWFAESSLHCTLRSLDAMVE